MKIWGVYRAVEVDIFLTLSRNLGKSALSVKLMLLISVIFPIDAFTQITESFVDIP